MRILAIVHEDDAGPGVFGEVAAARGCELHEWRIAAGERRPAGAEEVDAVLALGGSMDAHEHDRHPWLSDEEALMAEAIERRRPVLGVCLGAQILARTTGGLSGPLPEPEIGWYGVECRPAAGRDPLLGPLGSPFEALHWHSCQFNAGNAGVVLADSARCQQAFRVGEFAWGIQFHAEVTLTGFEAWLDDWLAHPEAARGPSDPRELRARTRELITGWNALGRALFGRFLDQALIARRA